MKLKIFFLTAVSFGLMIYMNSCDSSSYEIEELAVNEDSVNASRNAEIKQDIGQRSNEIKEETTQIRKGPQTKFTVQVGAFEIRTNAEDMLKKVKEQFGIEFESRLINGLYKIQTKLFDTQDEAIQLLNQLKEAGLKDGFITGEGK